MPHTPTSGVCSPELQRQPCLAGRGPGDTEVWVGESLVVGDGVTFLTSSFCLPRILCSMVSSVVKRETVGRKTRIGGYNAARGWQSQWRHAKHAWPTSASTNFLCIGCCCAAGSVEGMRRKP